MKRAGARDFRPPETLLVLSTDYRMTKADFDLSPELGREIQTQQQPLVDLKFVVRYY